MQINLDSRIFAVAGTQGNNLTLFKREVLTDWPEKLTYGKHLYVYEGNTTVPLVNQDLYQGAANYVRNTACAFNEAWVGTCGKEVLGDTDFCILHTESKCKVCEAQAEYTCDNTSGLVCGTPLCGSSLCKAKHRIGHSMPKLKDTPSIKRTRELWCAIDLLQTGLSREEIEEVIAYTIAGYENFIKLCSTMKQNSIGATEQHQLEYFQNDYAVRLLKVFDSGKTWGDYYEENE